MHVLVTGGCGYIGSHTVVELLSAGYEVGIVDNLSNSSDKVIGRIEQITGKTPKFFNCDLHNTSQLQHIFQDYNPQSIIHFAGLKAVGESVEKPLEYYHNNVSGTVNLLSVARAYNVKQLVFSSSATVYGDKNPIPYVETMPLAATSPYGNTKVVIEQILMDFCRAYTDWSVVSLRYFNPIGAHKSGLIGEDPKGIPNNLMPFIAQVAVGKRDYLRVFGGDYPTVDGTGVRDYLHVVDLATGHIKALDYSEQNKGYTAINLGTGRGISVLEMVSAFEQNNQINIPYKIVERRAGDIAAFYADATLAHQKLHWQTQYGLDDMVKDTWNWQKNNPNGLEG